MYTVNHKRMLFAQFISFENDFYIEAYILYITINIQCCIFEKTKNFKYFNKGYILRMRNQYILINTISFLSRQGTINR